MPMPPDTPVQPTPPRGPAELNRLADRARMMPAERGAQMLATLARAWWHASTRPTADTFRRAIDGQGHLKTLGGVLVAAVLGVGCSWVAHRLLQDPQSEFMGLASMWVRSGMPAPVATWAVLVPVGVVYGFYSFEIVLFIFARLLGGKGSFRAQSYAQSLFYGPLALVQQVLVVIPVAGRVLFALVAAASLVPTTTSLKAAHGYSTARAVLTWVIPVVLNVLVVTGIVVWLTYTHR